MAVFFSAAGQLSDRLQFHAGQKLTLLDMAFILT